MGYPKNYIGISVSRETHQRIKDLKENPDDTFDSVLNKLLDLEEKYADEPEVFEYEYYTSYCSKLFKVEFGKKTVLSYFNPKSNMFEKDIRAWQEVNPLSEDDLNSFIGFIVKDSSLWLLYDMENEVRINNIHIMRV